MNVLEEQMKRMIAERAAGVQQRGVDLRLLWDNVENLSEHELEGVARTEDTMHLIKGLSTPTRSGQIRVLFARGNP